MKRAVLSILVNIAFFLAFAQYELPCGTEVPEDALEFEREFAAKRMQKSVRMQDEDTIIFALQIHVIRGSSGVENFPTYVSYIENGIIDSLNLYYAPAKVRFYLCDGIDYINDDTYRVHYQPNDAQLINTYNVSAKINLYYVDSLYHNGYVNGYAYRPSSRNLIIVAKKAWNESTVHEMGHYFSLYHTHDTIGGKEFVNGTNCGYTGDWCCDTPADPKLSYMTVDPNNCSYTGNAHDPNGDLYQPDATNLMSYSRKECRTHFSAEQYLRIRAYAEGIYTSPFVYNSNLENVTISSDTTITNDVITVKNVSVNNGNLQLNYCKEVTIEKNFEMQPGTMLTIEK